MESVYHIVTIRVNETSWAHIWRLHSCYLRTGYDRRRGISTVLKADDTTKSGVAAGKVEGSGWLLEVEHDQRKLGWRPDCTVELNC
jgi:hypothetical protein